MDVLILIYKKAVKVLMLKRMVLNGQEDHGTGEEHRVYLRTAVMHICQFAVQGSEMAQRTLLNEWMKDEHWIVRVITVTEAFASSRS